MKLTTKYTLYVLLVFAGIFLLSFLAITGRMKVGMIELSSKMISSNVNSLNDIMQDRLKFLPHLAVYLNTDPEASKWLEAKVIYFGSASTEVNLNFEYTWSEDKAAVNFSGIFGMFMIHSARLDLYSFFDDIIKKHPRFGGYFYVIDSLGNIVYHTIPERVGLNMINEGYSDLFHKIISQQEGFVDYEYKGEKVRAFFKRIEIPWKVVYYDAGGREKKIRLYLVNAITHSEISKLYSRFLTFVYLVLFPALLGLVAVASYVTAVLAVRRIRKQNETVKEFSDSVYSTAMNISASASEMERVAESSTEIAKRLTEITQNFATSVEEGRYEVDNSVKSIKSFLDLLARVNEEISKAVSLIESLNDLNDRIAYLSDTISVLAINASIESAKEKIDREGISKIVEHITRISKEARETSKQTKKTIDQIQKSLSQLALYSERVEREGKAIRAAIDNVSQVMTNFVDGIGQIRVVTENLMKSSSETTAGVEEIVSSLNELQRSIDRLSKMISGMKI